MYYMSDWSHQVTEETLEVAHQHLRINKEEDLYQCVSHLPA